MTNTNESIEADLNRLNELRVRNSNIRQMKELVNSIKQRSSSRNLNSNIVLSSNISPAYIMAQKNKFRKYLKFLENKIRVEKYIKNRRSGSNETTPWKFKYYVRTNNMITNLERNLNILKYLLMGINSSNNNSSNNNNNPSTRNLFRETGLYSANNNLNTMLQELTLRPNNVQRISSRNTYDNSNVNGLNNLLRGLSLQINHNNNQNLFTPPASPRRTANNTQTTPPRRRRRRNNNNNNNFANLARELNVNVQPRRRRRLF